MFAFLEYKKALYALLFFELKIQWVIYGIDRIDFYDDNGGPYTTKKAIRLRYITLLTTDDNTIILKLNM